MHISRRIHAKSRILPRKIMTGEAVYQCDFNSIGMPQKFNISFII
jgi:hypothetical protein